MTLDELEALEKAATPGPHATANERGPGDCDVVDGTGEWLAEFERAEDAALFAAARNALPALLRVARAAAQITGGPYELTDAHGRVLCASGDYRALAAALAALKDA